VKGRDLVNAGRKLPKDSGSEAQGKSAILKATAIQWNLFCCGRPGCEIRSYNPAQGGALVNLKKDPDEMMKKLEQQMSNLEKSIMDKAQKATPGIQSPSIKDESSATCASPCPSCFTCCSKPQFHYYKHSCKYCGNEWD
jgi:hypothetical protein